MTVLAIVLAVALAAALLGCVALALRGASERRLAASERRLADEQNRTLEAKLAAIVAQVSEVTAQSLAARERELAEHNARQVSPLFEKMKGDIDGFRRVADAARQENAKLGAALKEQLQEVGRKAEGLGRQADEFVAALKGGSKVQGNWGEGILSKTLEDAGLVKGENFVEQEGTRDDRPDVTVFDGAGHRIFIDAKVNITDFIAAVNASNEGRADEAAALVKKHAASVREQVKRLAEKKYPQKLEGAEIVVMFLPSEATYSAAVTSDPALVSFANAQRVVLATPQTLLTLLTLFRLGIVHQQVERNNAEIHRRAAQLIERVDAAFVAFEAVGKALETATAKYHDALRKLGLEEGGLNVLTPARELVRLTDAAAKRNAKSFQET